jgi:hypothetical protein
MAFGWRCGRGNVARHFVSVVSNWGLVLWYGFLDWDFRSGVFGISACVMGSNIISLKCE